MYHIEKGDCVNKYQRYENNPISAFIYKSLGILCISSTVSYTEYEISWVKNNMMCSKQQEPDIDL